MDISALIIIGISTFVGAFIQTNMGFGGAVVLINILPIFFSYTKSVALLQCSIISMNIAFSIIYRKKIKWKVMLPAVIPGTALSIFFTFVSINTAPEILNYIIGVIFILLSVYNLFLFNRFKIGKGPIAGIAMGSFSGLTNAFSGVAGPPIAIYFASSIDDKISYFATSQCFFFFSSCACIAVRLLSGVITKADVPSLLYMGIIFAIGSFAGLKVMKKINGDLLKKLIFSFVGLNGIYIIIKQIIA